MIALASLTSLVAGSGLAAFAPRAGLRAHTFESCGGLLMVAGLALLGAGLPLFR